LSILSISDGTVIGKWRADIFDILPELFGNPVHRSEIEFLFSQKNKKEQPVLKGIFLG
jgi:hypothetical protein